VDTRLRRLEAGDYDCLILAGAGLHRLGLAERITEVLRPDAFWPAVAQGALAVQVRADDPEAKRAVAPLDHEPSHRAVVAERACLATLAGGCLAPIGGWARLDAEGWLAIGACVLEERGGRVERIVAEARAVGDPPGVSGHFEAARLGRQVADALMAQGADSMLARVRASAAPPAR
jgi:hydroxymethylbilane synthase